LKNRFQQKGKTTSLVTSCFILTLLAFPIINSYIINQSKCQSFLNDILLCVILLTVFLSIFFSAILLFLKTSIHRKIISLMVALSLLLWFQGFVIVWKYGPLDGRAIPWNMYWVCGAIDTSIWFLIIFWAIIKTSFFYRFAQTIAKALILIQLLSVIVIFVQMPRDLFSSRPYIIDETSKFNFSKEKNVILIVIDEYQSNIFQEIITQNDSYRNIFNDFVYFRNALAPFSFTELSVPAILTGKFYDNSVKRSVFLKNGFLDKSIPKVLKENGFEVDLFPLKGWEYREMYFDESICSNLKKRRSSIKVQLKETLLLFDLALFRHLPHFIKKYIYSDNQWFFSRLLPIYYRVLKKHFNMSKNTMYKEERFVGTELPVKKFEGDKFIDSARSKRYFQTKNNVFKFYHLWGMHVPLRINEKSEIALQVEYNKENYTRQAKAYLETIKMFFEILKQEGVYDNCLIFVIGDHGSGRSKDMYINPVYDSHNAALNQVSPEDNFQLYKARGIPLVLAKPFNSREELKISDAPVSLIDIPKTIVSALEIKVDFPGLSMFEVEDDYKRKRYYGASHWFYENKDFVEPITMYVVNGFSWSNESWNMLSILPPKIPSKFSGRKERN
jgi:hypothetical protein